jgi:hypothetical protein
VTTETGNFPDAPHTITILANRDMISELGRTHRQPRHHLSRPTPDGLYLLVSLDEDGTRHHRNQAW